MMHLFDGIFRLFTLNRDILCDQVSIFLEILFFRAHRITWFKKIFFNEQLIYFNYIFWNLFNFQVVQFSFLKSILVQKRVTLTLFFYLWASRTFTSFICLWFKLNILPLLRVSWHVEIYPLLRYPWHLRQVFIWWF